MRSARWRSWDLPDTSSSALSASRGVGPSWGAVAVRKRLPPPRRDTLKSAEEIMNMLEAFDLTGSLRDAGELSGVSHHTVGRYVAAREELSP